MTSAIPIKPHHFVDILRTLASDRPEFAPHPYGHNVHGVAARLLDDRDAPLVIELGADAICAPCRHNVHGECDDTIDTSFRPAAPPRKQDWNLLIDRRWCALLGLQPGETITARRFCQRLTAHLDGTSSVYRELPPERCASRREELRRGIDVYLGVR